jgi:hypothetical protein
MPKERTFVAFVIEPHLKAGLAAVKERDGLPLNFQVSKAIERWLEEKGILITPKGAAKKSSRSKKK